jgi:hypothetical protein
MGLYCLACVRAAYAIQLSLVLADIENLERGVGTMKEITRDQRELFNAHGKFSSVATDILVDWVRDLTAALMQSEFQREHVNEVRRP